MSYEKDERRWDLTPVINLIYSLSSPDQTPTPKHARSSRSRSPPDVSHRLDAYTPNDNTDDVSILGNFDSLWTSLGKPLNVAPPEVKWDVTDEEASEDGDEESDPAAEAFGAAKGVRWRDEDGTADLEDNDEPETAPKLGASLKGSNRRRKRPGKRARQALRANPQKAYRGTDGPTMGTVSSDFESENELQILRESPITKARNHPPPSQTNGLLSPSSAKGSSTINYESSGPSSTSPPKLSILKPPLPWPVSNPFQQTCAQYPQIESVTGYSAPERKISLVMKLVKDFPEDCDTLVKLPDMQRMSSGTIDPPSDGIHVFVDCSNIIIGFFDTLKRARAIPPTARVRRAPMSFHNLALILERGRPTSKRVLVGSKPLIPAVQEAQDCGYETSILDRVMKARETPPRSKDRRSRKGDGHGYGHGTGTGSGTGTGTATSGPSSGSESSPPQHRLVEQAVDEILHLKLLESVVDHDAHPTTIVLATGDAAEAEYSAGFLRMVERALEKGWSVELVSFRQNTSYSYKKRAFRQKWRGRFRVVELDAYREELLDL